MRRLIAFAGAVAALACASIQAPPGGPQRKQPPELLSVTPESGAVNVTDKNAVFSFDVIVDDRAGYNAGLASSFIVSPSEGGTVVNWKRDHIEVRPKRGFRKGTAYSVTMLPGVSDLSRNALKETRVIIFSTGPTIPEYAVHGRVFDWMTEHVSKDARIDIIRLPDSLPYVGITDSTGQFVVGPLDTGTYTVRALLDNNHNGVKDPTEPWDTTRVVVKAESPFVELRAILRDSLPPRLLSVNPVDSLNLTLSFDRPLDPSAPLTPQSFRVLRADSTPLVVTRVQTQAQFQRIRFARDSARDVAKRDSIAKADTSRAKADTSRAKAPLPSPLPVPPAAGAGQRAPAVPAPKPSLPVPPREVVIELDSSTALRPLSIYRVTAIDVRGLTGLTKTSDRIITVPRRDTVKAAPPAKKP